VANEPIKRDIGEESIIGNLSVSLLEKERKNSPPFKGGVRGGCQ